MQAVDLPQVEAEKYGNAALFAERRVTAIGDIVGTPLYLSPEYIANGDCDERSDLYCAALIAYELLSAVMAAAALLLVLALFIQLS